MNKIKDMKETFEQKALGQHMRNVKYNPNINHENIDRERFLYYVNKFNYIHAQQIEQGCTPFFITLTLPSEYHEFKKTKTGYDFNPLYAGHTIRDGYLKLLEVFKELYNNFVVKEMGKAKKIKVRYIKVIEPHKTYTPHLHAVVYIPVGYDIKFLNRYTGIIKKHSLRQCQIEKLEAHGGSMNYLLKYVRKTLEGSFELKGWSSLNRITQVTTSNVDVPREVYKFFVRNSKADPSKYPTIFDQIKDQCSWTRLRVVVSKGGLGLLKSYKRMSPAQLLAYAEDHPDQLNIGYHTYNAKNPVFSYNDIVMVDSLSNFIEVTFEDGDPDILFSFTQFTDSMFDLPVYEEYEGLLVPLGEYYSITEISEDEEVFWYESSNRKYIRSVVSRTFVNEKQETVYNTYF
jgi:hypothetical protein